MDVLRLLKSFSPEEKEFLQTEKITAELPPEEWISFFRNTLLFDEKADSKRKKLMALAILALLLTPVIVFCVFFIAGMLVPFEHKYVDIFALIWLFVTILSAVPTLVFSIYKFVQYFKLRKFNVKCNNAIKTKALPVLTLLNEEVKQNQKIKLTIDLTDAVHKSKFIGKSPQYSKGVYHKVVDSHYKNNWMNGETTLADGTHLIWSIEDLLKQTKKSKWSATGKYKTKYKNSNKVFISLQAGVDRKNFTLPQRLKQKGAEGNIRTKKQGKVDWIQIKKTYKLNNLTQGNTNGFHIQHFIEIIASVYMRAKPNLNS